MKKEDLVAMGLTEEQADALIGKYGNMVPLERFNQVNEAKKELEGQLTERDEQLKSLQKDAKGNEELTAQLKALQEANDKAKTDYEAKLKDVQLTSSVKLAIAGKVHDADLVAGLLDKTQIELAEDGSITKGLEEQLKSLQESKSFLFVPETAPEEPEQKEDPLDLKGTKTPEQGNPSGQNLADAWLKAFE